MSTDAFNILIFHTHQFRHYWLLSSVSTATSTQRWTSWQGCCPLWCSTLGWCSFKTYSIVFQCYFFLFLYQSLIFTLTYSDVQPDTKTRVFMPICVPFPEPLDPSLGFLSHFCRLQGDEHGAFCQQRVILARTFSTSHSWEHNTLFCTGTDFILCCQQNRSATLYRHQCRRPS